VEGCSKSLRRLFRRGNDDPERLREEAENRYRAEQEIRAAEQRRTEDQRGLEGAQKGLPYGRP
jgi:hypothetical protein